MDSLSLDFSLLEKGATFVRAKWPEARPRCGLVLGSGWSDVASLFEARASLNYSEIPGFGASTVLGHSGKLYWGDLAGVETFIFAGRRHFYEGDGWTPSVMPVYVLKKCQAEMVFLTNAAGGIGEGLAAGDLMIVSDHINFMGRNPLIGAHNPNLGVRFPDQSQIYSKELIAILESAAENVGENLKSGVYLAVTGPCYETPAEIQMFKRIGADAVGMSTVPEAIIANALELETVALSCICNLAAGIATTPLSHEEVASVGASVTPRVKILLGEFWKLIGKRKI